MNRHRWPQQFGCFLPILLLAFALRIAYLDVQSLWWDEAFSVSMSDTDPLSVIVNAVNYRVHPPLYYMLLHYWLSLGHSDFWLRLPSVFFGVISIAVMYATANLIGGSRLAILATFLLALSPFNVWYSQEVRMYTLTTALVLASSFLFLRLLRRSTLSDWLCFGLCTLLALYSDYLHLFVILAQASFLVVLRRSYRLMLIRWFLCMIVVAGLYVPWLAAVFLSGGFYHARISWISPVDPTDLFWTVYNLVLGPTTNPSNPLNVATALFVISLMIYGFVLLRRQPRDEQHRLGFVWFWLLLPIILTLLISLDWPVPQKRSIYIDRFFNPLVPAFLILASFGILRVFKKKAALGVTALVVVLIPVGVSLHNAFFNEQYARDQWRQAIAQIRESAKPTDLLLMRPHHYVPFYHYSPGSIVWYTVPYLESRQDYETELEEVRTLAAQGAAHIWAIVACENADTHLFEQNPHQQLMAKVDSDEIRGWLMQHYRLVEEWEYNGIYLAMYGDWHTGT